MAEANLNVAVATEVEFEVGEKTSAWLVSLGWTPPASDATPTTPAPADVTGLGSDMVFNTRAPYTSMPEAMAAMNGRQAAKYQALQDYQAMLTELSSPERLTNLLKFFGVQVPMFTGEPDAKTDA